MAQDAVTDSSPASPGFTERRRYRRFPLVQAATIRTRPETIECSTLDISAFGLKVKLAEKRRLPRRFVFSLDNRGEFAGELLSNDGRTARVRLLSDAHETALAVADVIPVGEFLRAQAGRG